MIDLTSFNNNLEGSSLTNIIIISLLSFALSSLIGITYEKTSNEIEKPRYYIQALILISVPVAGVMQAIGDSLAHGLGLLGALAIIRFRTTLRNPRNIAFMFASIAVGVATGVYGISIAVIGTVMFCLIAIVLHISHLGKSKYVIGFLQFDISSKDPSISTSIAEIKEFMHSKCEKVVLLNYVIKDIKRKKKIRGMSHLEYKIKVTEKHIATNLVNELTGKFNLLNVKLNFKDDYEKI